MKQHSRLSLIIALLCLLAAGALKAHGQTATTTLNNVQPKMNYTPLNPANNLSDLSSKGTALNNLLAVGRIVYTGSGAPTAACSSTANPNYLAFNTAQQVYGCGLNATTGTWGWFLINQPASSGGVGPAGPQGPQGVAGPPGPAGASAPCPAFTFDANFQFTPAASGCGGTVAYIGPGSGQVGGDPTVQLPPISYSALIAIHPCTGTSTALSPDIGRFAIISDSTVNSLGQLITTGGGNFVTPAVCNGTAWMVE